MINSSAMRVAPGGEAVSIWSAEIFGDEAASSVREFVARAFSVREVERVELRRAASFGRIWYGAVANPSQIWRKLSRALRGVDDVSGDARDAPAARVDAALVYLDGPVARPVRISRVGSALTTWRVRHRGDDTLRVSHPLLRNRRDVAFRVEEELTRILGIESVRASALTGGVSIRFDRTVLTVDFLARELEKAWPRVLDGLDGPPSRKRFVASVGLLGLATTGQYFVPALRPVAVAGVALYGAPNVVRAARDVTRGQVGLSALYSTGLAFMLMSGMPFSASLFALLMQTWPQLGRRKLVRSQRRLFARQRRLPAWVRVARTEDGEIELHVDDLRSDDRVVVRRGEIVPVDGVVEDGHAAILDAPFGADQVEDRAPGDAVAAGALVRDGSLTIRAERAGTHTDASYLGSLLPHGGLSGMPSSLEAERIANRNAKPALAVALGSFLLTRTLRVSQAVIRPDYATAPRLSAELAALRGIAHALQRGVVFRNPAALDRVAAAQVIVLDASAGLDRRALEVAQVQTVSGVSAEFVVGYALAALKDAQDEQIRALTGYASSARAAPTKVQARSRHAGVTRYRNGLGEVIEVATPGYLAAANVEVPQGLRSTSSARRGKASSKAKSRRVELVGRESTVDDHALRPLWVLRDGAVLGVVSFARTGEPLGAEIVSLLRREHARARIVYLGGAHDAAAKTLASKLEVDDFHADLDAARRVDLIRGFGASTLWIGDGARADARESILASTVSVSTAPLGRARSDAADILLPQRGLAALPALFEIGREHARWLEGDYRTVYATNLLGVAGGLFARFGSLHSGLLSNFGTALIYARHARALDKLAASADVQRTRLLLT